MLAARYVILLSPIFAVANFSQAENFQQWLPRKFARFKPDSTDQKVLKIIPEGLETANGIIKADVIVLANGFKTNEFLDPLQVRGRNGISLTEHWASFGGPSAYNCSVMSGFPNFFLLLGPNAATGHTSALMVSEK